MKTGKKINNKQWKRREFLLNCHRKASVDFTLLDSVVWCIYDVILIFTNQFTIVFPWLYNIWQPLVGWKTWWALFIYSLLLITHISQPNTFHSIFPAVTYVCMWGKYIYVYIVKQWSICRVEKLFQYENTKIKKTKNYYFIIHSFSH